MYLCFEEEETSNFAPGKNLLNVWMLNCIGEPSWAQFSRSTACSPSRRPVSAEQPRETALFCVVTGFNHWLCFEEESSLDNLVLGKKKKKKPPERWTLKESYLKEEQWRQQLPWSHATSSNCVLHKWYIVHLRLAQRNLPPLADESENSPLVVATK